MFAIGRLERGARIVLAEWHRFIPWSYVPPLPDSTVIWCSNTSSKFFCPSETPLSSRGPQARLFESKDFCLAPKVVMGRLYPQPGSWRQEAVKLGQQIDEAERHLVSGQFGYAASAAFQIMQQLQKVSAGPRTSAANDSASSTTCSIDSRALIGVDTPDAQQYQGDAFSACNDGTSSGAHEEATCGTEASEEASPEEVESLVVAAGAVLVQAGHGGGRHAQLVETMQEIFKDVARVPGQLLVAWVSLQISAGESSLAKTTLENYINANSSTAPPPRANGTVQDGNTSIICTDTPQAGLANCHAHLIKQNSQPSNGSKWVDAQILFMVSEMYAVSVLTKAFQNPTGAVEWVRRDDSGLQKEESEAILAQIEKERSDHSSTTHKSDRQQNGFSSQSIASNQESRKSRSSERPLTSRSSTVFGAQKTEIDSRALPRSKAPKENGNADGVAGSEGRGTDRNGLPHARIDASANGSRVGESREKSSARRTAGRRNGNFAVRASSSVGEITEVIEDEEPPRAMSSLSKDVGASRDAEGDEDVAYTPSSVLFEDRNSRQSSSTRAPDGFVNDKQGSDISGRQRRGQIGTHVRSYGHTISAIVQSWSALFVIWWRRWVDKLWDMERKDWPTWLKERGGVNGKEGLVRALKLVVMGGGALLLLRLVHRYRATLRRRVAGMWRTIAGGLEDVAGMAFPTNQFNPMTAVSATRSSLPAQRNF
eukprot:TRINITY_DN8805_c4_g1_i1.p1 TRINITY_DN8805_c4_g1~~TRINITY_DN8805_c4_g1_i1.p1  ORF type:complete len:711 (-),score=107.19 TRINITY_DN8805_c4_g1_i1:1894-4026(-)